jgi:hypothetical protein
MIAKNIIMSECTKVQSEEIQFLECTLHDLVNKQVEPRDNALAIKSKQMDNEGNVNSAD